MEEANTDSEVTAAEGRERLFISRRRERDPRLRKKAIEIHGVNCKACGFNFGKSYGETLRRWDQSFKENWAEIELLGFDQRFYRLWRYYLAYCEAGFDQEKINIGHFVIQQR